MIHCKHVVFSALISVLLASCPHAPRTTGAAAAHVPRLSTVPSDLQRFESDVEDAFDAALGGDREGAWTRAKQLQTSWKTVRPELKRNGTRDESLARVDERLAAMLTLSGSAASSDLARALNAVSEPLDEVFAVYSSSAVRLLLRLDYLGRELLLDGRDSRWDLAEPHQAALNTTWNAILQDPRASSSRAEVIAFATDLERVRGAAQRRAAHDLEQASRALLEDVDGLEVLLAEKS